MARHEIVIPHFGANIDEGRLSPWLRKVGDAVREGDVLCTYETQKATFDIEAERDGYVLAIMRADELVPVLAVIGVLGDSPDESIEGR
jgi:dihydrolipoamide dehydrogenase